MRRMASRHVGVAAEAFASAQFAFTEERAKEMFERYGL